MTRLFALCAAVLLAGCASAPLPGSVAREDLAARVVPGQTTKPELLATLGKTRTVVFDSRFEAWLYEIPAGAGRYTEFVILLDPQGVVRKTRRGPTSTVQ
ncbi:hypothetical protein NX773_23195 [Massilia solisilvae]|uniref:Outer membrane protein assembly factor BamE n=1 Tax=Massilia solisilvae TaxID=1811225 RepID=A0ABT2BRP4_9BURK|nr:hypothetical protein [Massilia solisilvae]MCS0611071.1 hypothetical protein [Massilia solisilvae]